MSWDIATKTFSTNTKALSNINSKNLGFNKVRSGYSMLDKIFLFLSNGCDVKAVERTIYEAKEATRNMLATICYNVAVSGYDSINLPNEGLEVYVNIEEKFMIRIEKDDNNNHHFVYYKIDIPPSIFEQQPIIVNSSSKKVHPEIIPFNLKELCEQAIVKSWGTDLEEYQCGVFDALKKARLNAIGQIVNLNLMIKDPAKTNDSKNHNNMNKILLPIVSSKINSSDAKNINTITVYIIRKAMAVAAAIRIQYIFRKHKELLHKLSSDQNKGDFTHIHYKKDTPDQATYALLIRDGHIVESVKLPTQEINEIEGVYRRLEKKDTYGVTLINKKEGISEESPYTSSELVKIIHSVNKANKLCWKGSNNNEIDTIVITHDYGTKNGLGYYLARNAGDYDLGALLRTDTSPESAYDNDYRIAFGKVIRDVGLLCEAGYFPVDFKPANLQVKQVKIPKSNIDKQYNKIKIFLIDTNSICSVENPSYTQTTVYCNNRVHFKWHTDSTRNKYNGQVKVDFAIAMSLLELEGVDLDPLTNQLLGNKGVKQNDPILQKFIETHIQPKYKKDFENLVCFPSIYLVNLEKDKPAKVTGVYKMFKPTSPYYYHDHANNNNDQANNNSNEPSQSLHIKA